MIVAFAIAGLLLSAYALSVTYNAKRSTYKPLCDINENISCTKAFTSPAGKTLGLHNPVYGILHYAAILVFSYNPLFLLILTTLALLRSGQLAYISYVRMKNFCLVCSAIYVINIILFILSVRIF